MTRKLVALAVLAIAACSQSRQDPVPCPECAPGAGGVRIALTVNAAAVARVIATVTAADLTAPIVQELAIGGTPPVATGTIVDVPAGAGRVVTLESFAAAPEDAVVVYRGSGTIDVHAGQLSSVSVTLRPVVQDVAVIATFPAGDADLARVHHVAVTFSGARIDPARTWYLALEAGQELASGTAAGVPVGATRTVTVASYDAGGEPLHAGSTVISVAEGTPGTVQVALSNLGGAGSIGVTGGFCVSDCTGRVCGDDGCGASCGGCEPGAACVDGACGGSGGGGGGGTGTPSWTIAALTGVSNSPEDVWGSGANDVYVVGNSTIHHWDGSTWTTTRTSEVSLHAIWGSGANDIWAVGDGRAGGAVMRWDGNDWSTMASSTASHDVWGLGTNDVWAGANGMNMQHWRGSGWEPVPLGSMTQPLVVNGIWGSSANDVWAVGQTGTIQRWNGARWQRYPAPTTTYLWDVWGSGTADVWAVGNRSDTGAGLILHWNGAAWSTTPAGNGPLYGVWGSGRDDVWAVGAHGTALHWNGTAWSPVTTGTDAEILKVWGSGSSDVWGVGWDSTGSGGGVILRYH